MRRTTNAREIMDRRFFNTPERQAELAETRAQMAAEARFAEHDRMAADAASERRRLYPGPWYTRWLSMTFGDLWRAITRWKGSK